MAASILEEMARKESKSKDSDRKRVGISLRMDADLLERLDSYCDSQEIPLDRTAFIEVAVRKFLDAKEGHRPKGGE